jgi:plasmid stabilization system protein ParE
VTPTLVVRPEAETDLDEAFHWYDAQRAGLGQEFLDEVSRAFARIAKQPLRYAFVHREARRALLRRFPYAVFYVVRDGRVMALAVLHQRRNPRVARARARTFKAE